MSEKLSELIIVLKGEYALEICAGIYSQNKPEDHPYIDFIKDHGRLIKIQGWNLVHCEIEEQWAIHQYHLVDHIYKKGSTILEKHKDRKDILSALEELNKIEEKTQQQTEQKIPALT